MSLIAELKQIIYDLPLASRPSRNEIAHFCEHHGIRIEFTRARTTWHAMAPSAVRPWWMILDPIRHKRINDEPVEGPVNDNKNNQAVEVLEDA